MSQQPQKIKPIYRSQYISNEQKQQTEVCRKLDSSIPKTMPFAMSFVSDGESGPFRGTASTTQYAEQFHTALKPTTQMYQKEQPHTIPAATGIIAATSTAPKLMVESNDAAEVWEGSLNRYNTYPSKKTPVECRAVVVSALEALEQQNLVDWEMEGYQAFGRMYQQTDSSEYMIQVYQRRDYEYQSVIEIRRSGGDSFVHDELNRRILQLLEEGQVLERNNGEEEEEVDFGLSLTSALTPLPLDSSLWKESASSSSSGEEEISEDGDNNIEDGDKSIGEKNGFLSVQQMADELIDVVTDRASYQDIFRHSSGVLCQELQTNTVLLLYILDKQNIIKSFIIPLLDGFYDTLIIRNMLQAVKILLLQREKHKVVVYENCKKDLLELQRTWNKSVQHNCINVRFGRSQQVEKLCTECLKLLE